MDRRRVVAHVLEGVDGDRLRPRAASGSIAISSSIINHIIIIIIIIISIITITIIKIVVLSLSISILLLKVVVVVVVSLLTLLILLSLSVVICVLVVVPASRAARAAPICCHRRASRCAAERVFDYRQATERPSDCG